MSKTISTDTLVPEVFEPYVIEQSAVLTDFGDSEIVERGAQYDAMISEGASIIHLPAWKAKTISAQSRQIISNTNAFDVNKIDTAEDKARVSNDGNSWSVTFLAKFLSGDDPMAAIASIVASYWAEIDQTIIIQSIKGVIGAFDAASGDPNYLKIMSESIAGQSSSTKLTGSTFIDALQKLGDAAKSLTGIAMHSATQSALKKLDLIDYIPDSEGKAQIESFQGRRVITVDSMPTRAGTTDGTVYTSVLFGPQAFAFGNQNLSGEALTGGFGTEGVELARVALNHDSVLINRRRWVKHPRGLAWQESSIAEVGGPSDAELAEAAQWTAVWTAGYSAGVGGYKNIRLVAIDHNN